MPDLYASTNESKFSQSFLNLQKGFCCDDSNKDKLIRWIGCTPGIYKGAQTVFSSSDIGLCSWFQAVESYAFDTRVLEAGDVVEVGVDAEFLMIRVKWPSAKTNGDPLLESEKVLELGVNAQAGYVGMTVPFPIGVPSPVDYRYLVLKDLFIANAKSLYTPTIKLNNVSAYEVTVGILAAR
jgi:hypothetical protein